MFALNKKFINIFFFVQRNYSQLKKYIFFKEKHQKFLNIKEITKTKSL